MIGTQELLSSGGARFGKQSGSNSKNTMSPLQPQMDDVYSLHYSASPVLGDDVPTEEECRQILLSMQSAMDREAPVLTSKFNKRRGFAEASREPRSMTKPGLRIDIPKPRLPAGTAPSSKIFESSSSSTSGSETSQLRNTALTLWKRRKLSRPSRQALRDAWSTGLDLKGKISKLGLRGSPNTHKRGDSDSSKAACVLCRVANAPLAQGLCRACEDDFRTPQDFADHEDSASWLTPPPRLDHISFHCNPSSASLVSPQSVSQSSLSECRKITPSIGPPTPLSDLPTPVVESRLRGSRGPDPAATAEEQKDLYDEPWAEYYFDHRNFVRPCDAASVADRLIQGRLDLDEYEAVFASPIVLSPEGGWI
ncbi:hypothetical protein HJFPF1_11479 [Paramyrothecium foliicola]|nr:hypothetical protein HJFPF1_11479 [Paramyrothecium foliicola]